MYLIDIDIPFTNIARFQALYFQQYGYFQTQGEKTEETKIGTNEKKRRNNIVVSNGDHNIMNEENYEWRISYMNAYEHICIW